MPLLISDAKVQYDKNQHLVLASLKPELLRHLLSGDLSSMHSILDEQMQLHQNDWEKIQLKNIKGDILYPLDKTKASINENTIQINTNISHLNTKIASLHLISDWSTQKQTVENNLSQFEIYLFITFSLITIGSLIWQSRHINTPLLKLQNAATQLADGNFNLTLPDVSNDEIGQLTSAFKLMQHHLQLSIEETQQSDARQQCIIQTMSDALVTINTEGHIEDFNKAAENIFDYKAEEIINKDVSILMPEMLTNRNHESFSKYLKTGKALIIGQETELQAKRKNGGIIDIKLIISEIKTSELHIFSAIIKDITQQKIAAKELQLAATSFEAHEGIVITDEHTNILKINTAYTEITGYTSSDVIDKKTNILSSKQHDKNFYQAMWLAINNTGKWSGEIWNKRKNGEIYPQWLAITAIKNQQGEVSNYAGFLLDISELKKQQDELEHARDQAELASRSKSEFLSNISHEIRTPMNGVLGMIQIIGKTSLSTEQATYLQTIDKSAQQLLKILDDILKFSEIESDRLTLNKVQFKLNDLVNDIEQSIHTSISDKSLSYHSQFPLNCPQTLLADADKIQNVLLNLLSNSIKFTESGTINLVISCIRNELDKPVLKFEIIDTGIGIAEQNKADLFKAFLQLDGSRTRKYGGTGLGLALSKRLVDIMQGDIGFSSQQNIGSTFWFSLPVIFIDEIQNSSSSSNTELLDLKVFNELRHSMGQYFTELIPGFINETELKLNQLERFVEQQDSTKINLIIHTLQASSQSIGAHAFAEQIGTLQPLNFLQKWSEIKPSIDALHTSFQSLKLRLESIDELHQ